MVRSPIHFKFNGEEEKFNMQKGTEPSLSSLSFCRLSYVISF